MEADGRLIEARRSGSWPAVEPAAGLEPAIRQARGILPFPSPEAGDRPSWRPLILLAALFAGTTGAAVCTTLPPAARGEAHRLPAESRTLVSSRSSAVLRLEARDGDHPSLEAFPRRR
jgi:hypothetical protein